MQRSWVWSSVHHVYTRTHTHRHTCTRTLISEELSTLTSWYTSPLHVSILGPKNYKHLKMAKILLKIFLNYNGQCEPDWAEDWLVLFHKELLLSCFSSFCPEDWAWQSVCWGQTGYEAFYTVGQTKGQEPKGWAKMYAAPLLWLIYQFLMTPKALKSLFWLPLGVALDCWRTKGLGLNHLPS